MQVYRIAKEYTDAPGGRFQKDGNYSGEEFREIVLIPMLEKIPLGEKLLIDFDGAFGYPKSFLEESFGGLARKYTSKLVLEKLDFKSDDEPDVVKRVLRYINDVKK